MTNCRQSRAKKNIFTSLLSQIVVLVCGIIVPRLMIGEFGSEAYGATTSIAQFLAYVTLLEGGIGGVARAVLYKPLAQKDMVMISSIMGEIKRFFRIIAWVFAGYVLLLACCFQTISQITCMNWISTFFLVVVISISTFGQYFIGISNTILLQADQKSYITNALSIGATVLNAVFTIILIALNCNLIIVKLVSSLIFFMRPVALMLYVKKKYLLPLYIRKSENKIYLQQKWTGLGQHIAFFLHSNTGTAILTVLTDLRTVAVYSVYNMIVSHMQSLTISFSSGMEAVFGDMLARKEEKELHETFRTYETILSVVSIVLFSAATVMIIPFVKLYTAGITDAEYIQPLFAVVFILTALSYCLRQPYHAIVVAAGHFKQTSMAAYGEAAISIVLAVALVLKFGLIGVSIASLIATWFRFVYYVFYLSKNIFNRKIALFTKRLTINMVSFVLNCLLGYILISRLPTNNYMEWVFAGALIAALICVLTFGINLIFFKNDCKVLIKKIIK